MNDPWLHRPDASSRPLALGGSSQKGPWSPWSKWEPSKTDWNPIDKMGIQCEPNVFRFAFQSKPDSAKTSSRQTPPHRAPTSPAPRLVVADSAVFQLPEPALPGAPVGGSHVLGGTGCLGDLEDPAPADRRAVGIHSNQSFQPSFFSKTSCFSGGSDGFLERRWKEWGSVP